MSVNWIDRWLNNIWVQHALRVLMAATVTALLYPFHFEVMESFAYDLRMRFSPRPDPSGEVMLVPIDAQSMTRLKRKPEALDWAVVLQKISQASPLAVVSFINPSQIQGSYDDLVLLNDIAGRLPFFYATDDLPGIGLKRLEPLAAPFEHLNVISAPKTADTRVLARDGVTRRMLLSYGEQSLLHPRLAQQFNSIKDVTEYTGHFEFLGSQQLLINFREKGAFERLPFAQVLNETLDPSTLKGKVILIGEDTLDNASDYISTPLHNDLLALSVLEMHANMLDTLILNQAPIPAPVWLRTLFTFALSLLAIYIVLFARPARGLLALAAALGAFLVFAFVMFAVFRMIVFVANPLIGVLVCYYFLIPYRLIVENRRSWEYYQKNRLLEQVEELKSNFMRMMSHDLRTPLARIQGMADVIRKEAEDMTETQRLALETISESSEELTEFIGSILSLSRIESKEMKLEVRSKDINQLVREVIRKTDHLAKRKGIEVVTELEPLFSIKIDEDLLKTVLTNLIENAIKYSPENTRVLVTTEEHDNHVLLEVADQGRGIPQEDLGHVFDRFYRARNSRSNTPGTGLGLYLAKYFVELHNGRIEVESIIDKGSTFSVYLPMDLSMEIENTESPSGGLHV